MSNDEFYIGWMAKAPDGISKFVKKYLAILLPIVIVLAVSLALLQKKFGSGHFEFGKPVDVKGIYFNSPFAHIKVVNGKNIWGNYSYISIPLVGYGKHGADGIIVDLEKQQHTSLDKKEITLHGALLYNDGKLILQIDGNDNPLTAISKIVPSPDLLPQVKELGIQKVRGEIVDPKCYFGVMKPGQGKPHRDCAIRCILGGISPVMRVQNKKGEANYYILVGSNGEKMNQAVQDFVAEPVELEARMVQYDDWIVMYVSDMNNIRRVSVTSMSRPDVKIIACGNGCTK